MKDPIAISSTKLECLCVVLNCCFLCHNLEPGRFLLEAAMTWDQSDCKRDASSTKTDLYKTSLISTYFGTLRPGTNTNLTKKLQGFAYDSLKFQRRKESHFDYASSKLIPTNLIISI